MSIEHNVTTGASKTAQSAAGHGASRKSTGAADPGGFAALLLSLGADELQLDTALPGETSQDMTALPGQDSRDPAALAPTDATLAASQAPVLPALPATTSAQAIIVNPAATSTGAAAAVSGVVADARASRAESLTVQTQEPAAATGQADAGQEQAVVEVQPLLRQAGLAQRLAQQRSQAVDAAQAAQARRGEDIAARLGWQISEAPAVSATAPQALLAAGLGEAGLRPWAERQSDRHGARGGAGEIGAFAGVAQVEGARLDVPAVAPDAGLTTEMRVAEQVSYYVGRGAQSAELEVEGIDERPIHVSIDLQGQEARVEFRAEQAQTRQVLQDAVPHLREMLEREGLSLADVSVGSSGAQADQGQPGRERPGARQERVNAPEQPVLGQGARAPALNGRSVDLFV